MTATAKGKDQRERVHRVTDWADARYSFLPARVADDMRLTVIHMRLLAYLGRVNNNYGWTELSQKATAERWGYRRTSVNDAVKQLVDWGYIEKQPQAETKTAFCNYRILIDDPARQSPKPKVTKKASKKSGGVSGATRHPPRRLLPDTPVGQPPTPVSGHTTQLLDPSSGDHSPPKPPRGRRVRVKISNEVEDVLLSAAASRPDDDAFQAVLVDFLAPLIRQRHLDAPSMIGAVTALADWIVKQGLGEGEGRKVLAQLLERRKATVKPSDIETAVKTAIGHRPLQRQCTGDAALMRKWPAVVAELEKLIGGERTTHAFSTFALDSISEPNRAGKIIARVSTHADWAKRHVELSLSSQFRAAMSAVFPGVSDIWIETRRTAA